LELSQCDLQTRDDSVNQFVIVFLLVFGYQEELSVASQLADVMYALRTVARKEMGDFTVELGVHGSLPRLSGLLEVIGRRDYEPEQVAMDLF
jgi:hypothetical protein